MRKFDRVAEPAFLVDKWEQWGLEWEERRNKNKKAQFHWHEIDGEKVNVKLLPLLKSQTQGHCSFCDAFPVAPPSIDTIEHFRPKSTFPKVAYQWANLYFCCMHCQQKGEEFSDALLPPDEVAYSFDRYFRWDFTTGELHVNTLAAPEDQNRATVTIELYRLNVEHPKLRMLAAHIRPSGQSVSEDLLPYRHYILESS